MGLLDLFKRGMKEAAVPLPSQTRAVTPVDDSVASAPAAEPVKRAVTRMYAPSIMMDMADNAKLEELFQVPREERRVDWTDRFFRAVWRAPLEVPQPKPAFDGPDGFPYLRLHLPKKDTPFDPHSVAEQAEKLLDRGVGVAIFASPEATEPQYVMQVGLIDCLVRYDAWMGDPQDRAELNAGRTGAEITKGLQEFTTEEKQEMLIGSPSEIMLPAYTAKALYRHLKEGWHIEEPRIALMMGPKMVPTRSLVIGKKFSEFPDAETAARQARMLLWYLPPQRSLMLQPESMKPEELRPLTDFFLKKDESA